MVQDTKDTGNGVERSGYTSRYDGVIILSHKDSDGIIIQLDCSSGEYE